MSHAWRTQVVRCLLIVTWAFSGISPSLGQAIEFQHELQLGGEAMHSGALDAAESHFRRALQLAPNSADGYLNLGLVFLREGKLQDAAPLIRKSLELNPSLPGANLFLGIIEYQTGELDRAHASVQRETELNRGNADAWMWLGVIELADGAADKAVAPLDRAALLDPKNLSILDYRARAHLIVSEETYRQMYKLAPKSWQVHRVRAQLAARSERHKEAIVEYETALRLAPDEVDLYDELGGEYRKNGNLEQAESMYAKELQISPHHAVALYNLGAIRVDRGNPTSGIPLLQEALKLNANSPMLCYYLGHAFEELGEYGQAATYFEKVVQISSDTDIAKTAYYRLFQIYRKLQRRSDSDKALHKYESLREKLTKETGVSSEEDSGDLNEGKQP